MHDFLRRFREKFLKMRRLHRILTLLPLTIGHENDWESEIAFLPTRFWHADCAPEGHQMSTHTPEVTLATKVVVLRRERATREHSLEQIEGDGAPRRVLLDKAEHCIGRANEADVRVQSQRASRQHAFLARRGAEFVLRDNDSHNGVFLNGVKIHSAILRDGDVLQVADCAFVYREG